MTIQDVIIADQAAIVTAQAALDKAVATLAADQAKAAAIQPHLDMLAQVEAELLKIEDGLSEQLKATIAGFAAQVSPFLQQMRAAFTAA